MSTIFRYIHFSDTHFCIYPNRTNLSALLRRGPSGKIDIRNPFVQRKALGFESFAWPASFSPRVVSGVAQFCVDQSPECDAILVTGDLATTGIATDIEVANTFLTAAPQTGYVTGSNRFPTISGCGVPIIVLPGNHDKYVDNKATPDSKTFELKFGNLMPNYRARVGHTVHSKGDVHLGIISGDFSLTSKGSASRRNGHYGQGRVSADTLQELQSRTLELRKKYDAIEFMWMVHFAPFNCGRMIELVDWEKLVDAATALRVKVSLCGHTHRTHRVDAGRHTILGAGTAGCVEGRDTMVHVISIEIGYSASVMRENFRWNPKNFQFEHDSFD